ncbi:hypothetical protein K0M31_002386, partial [Melipona bicolor]
FFKYRSLVTSERFTKDDSAFFRGEISRGNVNGKGDILSDQIPQIAKNFGENQTEIPKNGMEVLEKETESSKIPR